MTKKLQIILLILILVLLGEYIWLYSIKQNVPSTPPITDTQRLEALQKTSDIPPANPKMTDTQRLKLMNQSSKIAPLKTN